jgi:hypothetical protein
MMDAVIVQSCHSTWVFDPDRMRFCRILKGIEVAHRLVSTDWRPYSHLKVDPGAETFCVYLDSSRTHLIRTWRHTQNCAQCGVHETTELSVEDIQTAVRGVSRAGRY